MMQQDDVYQEDLRYDIGVPRTTLNLNTSKYGGKQYFFSIDTIGNLCLYDNNNLIYWRSDVGYCETSNF